MSKLHLKDEEKNTWGKNWNKNLGKNIFWTEKFENGMETGFSFTSGNWTRDLNSVDLIKQNSYQT